MTDEIRCSLPVVSPEIHGRVAQVGVGLVKTVGCCQHHPRRNEGAAAVMNAPSVPQGHHVREPAHIT